ncbi:MAG: phosphoenolpyruvate carboxylase [Ignisphaera sp.]|nr:phosphoenolpyruvate carboxylase [Ignisphaera sp.]MCX8167606.1 phosphoenolpyruvate carboxylase [Ignisphaera sp.]MDW8086192.1 phosphoenolpyruvate carboxylase [Ignisphaera sp.]
MIPRLMCTQHPDSTVRVTAQEEVDEAIQGFSMYGCDEVMSDYEGKLTPYSQPKDIVMKAKNLDIPVGEKLYITPRIPNPKLEDFDRVALTLEAALIANYYAYKYLGTQAVKWIILPMVESTDVIRLVQRLIIKKSKILYEEMGVPCTMMQLVPLVEDSSKLIHIHEYIISLYDILKEFDADLKVLRVFLGKSDTATKSGHIASALSMMYALHEVFKIDEELDIDIKPIIGMGSPPFRGGINNPKLVDMEVEQYRGFSTVTIQSAIRYDVTYSDYQRVQSALLTNIGGTSRKVDPQLLQLVDEAAMKYRALVARYIDVVNKYASVIPTTRDRISWREYGRSIVLEDKMLSTPRAIVYTATWYILGVPPLLLDADFIIEAYRRDAIDWVFKYMPYLKKEWEYEAQFYVPQVAERRLDGEIVLKINKAMDVMGVRHEPAELYRKLIELNPIEPYILSLGKMRGFLG